MRKLPIGMILGIIFLAFGHTPALAQLEGVEAPLQPWEYNEALAKAHTNAKTCFDTLVALAAIVPDAGGRNVLSAEVVNGRKLAEGTCWIAFDTLSTIRAALDGRPYNPSGPTVNPNP